MALSVDIVVVPVTFEPDHPTELNAERAIEVRTDHWVIVNEATVAALRLATRVGETVHLVHATLDLSPTAAVHGPAGMLIPANVEQLHEASNEHAIGVLNTLAERFCKGTTPILHASPGKPLDVVLAYSRDVTADLLVLAASGRNRMERFIVGSTVDKVVRQATCPVLVVPH